MFVCCQIFPGSWKRNFVNKFFEKNACIYVYGDVNMCARVTNDRLEHCSATNYDDSTLSVVLKLVQPLGVGSAITFILKEKGKTKQIIARQHLLTGKQSTQSKV